MNVFLAELTVKDPATSVTTTNLCIQAENFGTTWVPVGSPTRSAAAHTVSGVTLDLIGDDSAAALEYYEQVVGFTGDGVKAISVHLKKGTSTTTMVRLKDGAGASFLLAIVTWSGTIPVVTMTTGTFLRVEEKADAVYRFYFSTTSVTAVSTNTVQILPATTAAFAVATTGNIYAGGVQAENATTPGPYVKTTTVAVASTQPLVTILRTCTGVGFTTGTTDGPASTNYLPRLTGCRFRYDSSVNTLKIGHGELEFANRDGELDTWADYIFDNGEVTLLYGEKTAAYSTYKKVARWAMEQCETTDDALIVRTRTPAFGLDKPFQPNVFTGVSPVVDLGVVGKPKSTGVGALNAALPGIIDTSKQIYHLADDFLDQAGAAATAMTVSASIFDSGVALTGGADYGAIASMTATAPAAGGYRVLPVASSGDKSAYFRLGSVPTGTVTALLTILPDAGAYEIRDAVLAVLKAGTGRAGTEILTGDFADLDTTLPVSVGIYVTMNEKPTYLEMLDNVLTGVHGWAQPYPLSFHQWAVRFLRDETTAPAPSYTSNLGGPADVQIVGDQIFSMRRIAAVDGVQGIPAYRLVLRVNKNSYVQSSTQLAGQLFSVSGAGNQFSQPWYDIPITDSTVLTSYPTAQELIVESGFYADAGGLVIDEAERQAALFAEKRDTFEVRTRVDMIDIALSVPGDPCTISDFARYRCDSSREFLMLGYDIDFLTYDPMDGTITMTATLWGA